MVGFMIIIPKAELEKLRNAFLNLSSLRTQRRKCPPGGRYLILSLVRGVINLFVFTCFNFVWYLL